MKILKEKFGELSARIKASGQPARTWFPQYTPASLLNAENWWGIGRSFVLCGRRDLVCVSKKGGVSAGTFRLMRLPQDKGKLLL